MITGVYALGLRDQQAPSILPESARMLDICFVSEVEMSQDFINPGIIPFDPEIT
ncbi:MAG: hypothetical protein HS120_04350 [Burkholderiales bacterium]|nr:hypothetical protein [Burkholderiales bacterium]